MTDIPDVRLRGWAETDLDLLRAINAPSMTEFLGGPENEEKLLKRHRRYTDQTAAGAIAMFVVEAVFPPESAVRSVGSIGYWPISWDGEDVYETGWSILPDFQGHGLATTAARLVAAQARSRRDRPSLHAFPKTAHTASNAICRKAGFEFVGEREFEYPAGHPIRVNDWALTLIPQT
jgi:RimJ/RimL family protein N-acetyltransferase